MALKLSSKLAALAMALVALPSLALHAEDGATLIKGSDCLSCHAVNRKVVGPAYLDVAKKYKGASAAQIKILVAKVKNGGSGNWGAVPMAAHPNISDADLETMVRYVLSLKPGASLGAAPAAAAPAAVATAAPAPAAAAPQAAGEAPKTAKKRAPSHLRPEEPEAVLAFDTDEEIRSLMEKNDCYGCHSGVRRDGMSEDAPWPSFVKIEAKYKNAKNTDAVVTKVYSGDGKLSWGKVPHPKFDYLPKEAVGKMVAYIVQGKASKGLAVVDPNNMGAEEWMRKAADCFSCHSVNNKVVGPAYRDVAKKYAGASEAQIKVLVKKVKEGGSGNWGTVAMAAHPNATDAQLEKAVRWVLEQK